MFAFDRFKKRKAWFSRLLNISCIEWEKLSQKFFESWTKCDAKTKKVPCVNSSHCLRLKQEVSWSLALLFVPLSMLMSHTSLNVFVLRFFLAQSRCLCLRCDYDSRPNKRSRAFTRESWISHFTTWISHFIKTQTANVKNLCFLFKGNQREFFELFKDENR